MSLDWLQQVRRKLEMIDREGRAKLASLIAGVLDGRSAIQELRDLDCLSDDPGVTEVGELASHIAWRCCSRAPVSTPSTRQRELLERCALFLRSDISYGYYTDVRDDYNANPLFTWRSCLVLPIAGLVVAACGLLVEDPGPYVAVAVLSAVAAVLALSRWNDRARGIDRGLWPFLYREDYERALQSQAGPPA